MSNIPSEEHSEVSKLKAELKNLRKSYNSLNEKYLKLAACHKCIGNSEENESEKSATQKSEGMNNENENYIDEHKNPKDPLESLPEPCAVKIMEYLTGNELKLSMEVSKSWNNFIKNRSVLMDKIILKPTHGSGEFFINQAYNKENMRRYKHYKGPLYIFEKYEEKFEHFGKVGFIEVCPIALFASSLETAVIEPERDDENEHRCCDDGLCPHSKLKNVKQTFSQLKKLTYPVNCPEVNFSLLESSKFPNLTHLNLTETHGHDMLFSLKRFLCSFPKLEILLIDYNYNMTNIEIGSYDLPNVKELCASSYWPQLMKEFESSLERYEDIWSLTKTELNNLLKNYKNLKSLSVLINVTEDREERKIKYVKNTTIESLYIGAHARQSIEEEYGFEDILIALPSLKKLFYGYITVEELKFVANNMLNLKELGCEEITEELREAYEEIQGNPNNFLNSNFIITETPWHLMEDYFPNELSES